MAENAEAKWGEESVVYTSRDLPADHPLMIHREAWKDSRRAMEFYNELPSSDLFIEQVERHYDLREGWLSGPLENGPTVEGLPDWLKFRRARQENPTKVDVDFMMCLFRVAQLGQEPFPTTYETLVYQTPAVRGVEVPDFCFVTYLTRGPALSYIITEYSDEEMILPTEQKKLVRKARRRQVVQAIMQQSVRGGFPIQASESDDLTVLITAMQRITGNHLRRALESLGILYFGMVEWGMKADLEDYAGLGREAELAQDDMSERFGEAVPAYLQNHNRWDLAAEYHHNGHVVLTGANTIPGLSQPNPRNHWASGNNPVPCDVWAACPGLVGRDFGGIQTKKRASNNMPPNITKATFYNTIDHDMRNVPLGFGVGTTLKQAKRNEVACQRLLDGWVFNLDRIKRVAGLRVEVRAAFDTPAKALREVTLRKWLDPTTMLLRLGQYSMLPNPDPSQPPNRHLPLLVLPVGVYLTHAMRVVQAGGGLFQGRNEDMCAPFQRQIQVDMYGALGRTLPSWRVSRLNGPNRWEQPFWVYRKEELIGFPFVGYQFAGEADVENEVKEDEVGPPEGKEDEVKEDEVVPPEGNEDEDQQDDVGPDFGPNDEDEEQKEDVAEVASGAGGTRQARGAGAAQEGSRGSIILPPAAAQLPRGGRLGDLSSLRMFARRPAREGPRRVFTASGREYAVETSTPDPELVRVTRSMGALSRPSGSLGGGSGGGGSADPRQHANIDRSGSRDVVRDTSDDDEEQRVAQASRAKGKGRRRSPGRGGGVASGASRGSGGSSAGGGGSGSGFGGVRSDGGASRSESTLDPSSSGRGGGGSSAGGSGSGRSSGGSGGVRSGAGASRSASTNPPSGRGGGGSSAGGSGSGRSSGVGGGTGRSESTTIPPPGRGGGTGGGRSRTGGSGSGRSSGGGLDGVRGGTERSESTIPTTSGRGGGESSARGGGFGGSTGGGFDGARSGGGTSRSASTTTSIPVRAGGSGSGATIGGGGSGRASSRQTASGPGNIPRDVEERMSRTVKLKAPMRGRGLCWFQTKSYKGSKKGQQAPREHAAECYYAIWQRYGAEWESYVTIMKD